MTPEKTLARVGREARATVRCNAKLREMNVDVAATDERASGLPPHHRAQFAVDITLKSGHTLCGSEVARQRKVQYLVGVRGFHARE